MLTLWKSLIMCHLDYCSQLWSPSAVGHTQSLELLQKAFISRINGMRDLSYWEQLKELKLYSLERRRERYQAIYTWRIIEGHVPNIDSTPIRACHSKRRGRSCSQPPLLASATERIKSIRFASLAHKGPRIFNSLPPEIRNLTGCSVEVFKAALDRYLRTIPDEPLIPSMVRYKTCDTNSVISWAATIKLRRRDSCAMSLNPTASGQSTFDGLLE